MSANPPSRLALIGLGRVAWLLEADPLRGKPCTHLGAWSERTDVVLAAGCDTDPDRRHAFQERYPAVPVYEDYAAMLAHEAPDFVSVCAYAGTRCEMVLACVEAGVRGIWCEKAMATSLEQAWRMEQVLKARGTAMIVSFMRRWSPIYLQVKDLLAQGAIGELESVNVQFSSNMLHTGTHAFDVLRLWCGEVQNVQAWLDADHPGARQSGYQFDSSHERDDLGGFAVLTFASGARALIHARDKGYFRFEFELLGTRGMLRVGNSQRELWIAEASPRLTDLEELTQVEFPSTPSGNVWRAACANLVAAAAGREAPACGVVDGRKSLEIALATHMSHRRGGHPVTLKEVPRTLCVDSR